MKNYLTYIKDIYSFYFFYINNLKLIWKMVAYILSPIIIPVSFIIFTIMTILWISFGENIQ